MYFGWGITPPSPFPYRYFVVSGKPTDAGKQAAVQAARRAAEDEAVFRAGLKESYK
jgi:hypothetical protein